MGIFGVISKVIGIIGTGFNIAKGIYDMVSGNKADKKTGQNLEAIDRNYDLIRDNNGLMRTIDGKVDRNFGAIKQNLAAIIDNGRAIQRVSYKIDKAVEILGNGLDRNLKVINQGFQKTFLGLTLNMIGIYKNFEAIKTVESKVDRNLIQIMLKFSQTQESINEMKEMVKNQFKELREYVKKTKVEAATSDLIIFMDEFVTKRDLAKELTKEELLVFLEGEHSNGFLNKIKDLDILHESISKIINYDFAIPENPNDEVAFSTINLLLMGTSNYVSAYFFLILSYKYLANHYHELRDLEKFNKYTAMLSLTIKNFDRILVGQNGENGLLDKVEKILNDIKSLDFIKQERRDLVDLITGVKKLFKPFKSSLRDAKKLNDFIESKPEIKIEYDFSKTQIKTPIGQWVDFEKVSYAIQYRNGTELSQVSDWSKPYEIYEEACPLLKLKKSTIRGERLIFRKFFGNKPELVKIIKDEKQEEFRDISKDLFDAIFENENEKLSIRNMKYLLSDVPSKEIDSFYENEKPLIHHLTERNKINHAIELIENYGLNISANDLNGKKSIHLAAELGHTRMLKLFVEHKEDINSKTSLNWTPFHYACKSGDEELVGYLIKKGANILLTTKNGFNAFHIAISSGKCNLIKFLRKNSKLDINSISNKGLSPLHLAILNENVSCVEDLIENNNFINVNIQEKEGKLTPLHLGASIENLESVKHLLQHKNIDVNYLTSDGWSALHLSILSKKEDITLELLKTNIDVNLKGKSNLTSLHLAVIENQEQIVKALLNKKAHIEERALEGSTALHMAVEKNNANIVKLLVENGAKLNVRQENGNTPLLLAASDKSKLKIVKYLTQKGARLDDENDIGNTPIDIASSKGNLDAFRYLEENGANLETALNLAAYGSQLEILNLLIEKGKSIFFIQDKNKNSILHYAALNGNTMMLKYLIRKDEKSNFDLNVKNNDGDTILNLCASIDNYDCVRYLSTMKKIDLNSMNDENYTPILKAADSQNWSIVDFLVNKKVDIKKESKHGNTVLHFACRDNKQEAVDYLLDKIEINILNKDKWSPLSFAAKNGHLNLTRYLIEERKADYKLIDKNNMSILHLAVMSGNLELIKYLAEEKNIQINSNGNSTSCLHLAVKYDHLDIIKYLLEKDGSNINAIDEFGNTPILLAAKENSWSSVKFLIEKGANIDILDKNNMSILHEIARDGKLSILKLLKDKKINLKKRIKNNQGMTCLHISALNSRFELIKWFMDNDFAIDRDNLGNNLLHYSAQVNDLLTTKFLSKLLDPNQENYSKETPCSLTEDLKLARYLIEEKNADYINDLFIVAKKNNNLGVMKYLIEDLNLDPNQTDKEGKNILIVAAESNHLNKVKYLVNDLKIDINKKDNFGKTATDYSIQNNYSSIKLYLDEMNSLKNITTFGSKFRYLDINSDIFKAIETNDFNLFKYFLDVKKIDLNTKKGAYDKSLLHLTSIKGNLEMVKYLVNNKKMDSNIKDKSGSLAIHDSIIYGHLDVTKFFIEEKNVPLDVRGRNDMTPLHFAILNNQVETVKYLVGKGANTNARNSNNHAAIHLASISGNLNVVKLLIEKRSENLELTTYNDKYTPLLLTCYFNKIEIIKYLVSKNANINARNNDDEHCIHLALRQGSFDVSNYLIDDLKIGLEIRSSGQNTPLHLAVVRGDLSMVKYLLSKGANTNARNSNNYAAIHLASISGNLNVVKLLIEKRSENLELTTYNDKYTPLLLTCYFNKIEIIKYLVSKNANINARNNDNEHCIHLALRQGSFDVSDYLIDDLKIGLEIRSSGQNTPLHSAADDGDLSMVKYLVSKGANTNARNIYDYKPIDLAYLKGHQDVIRYLEKFNFMSLIANKSITKIEKKKLIQQKTLKKISKAFSLNDNYHLMNYNSQSKMKAKLLTKKNQSTTNAKLEVESLDINNSLMLMNILVRKYTNEKFISEGSDELSVLDAKIIALNILESFENILAETLGKYGIQYGEYLNFDPTLLISDIVWYLRNGNKLDKISDLLILVLEKNYKQFENANIEIKKELVESLENVLIKELNIQYTDDLLSSNYSLPVFKPQIQLIDDLRLKIDKN